MEGRRNVRTEEKGNGRTHFLISYLSSWPFFTLAKSQATTYWPVDVTIAFSSFPSPMLNLQGHGHGHMVMDRHMAAPQAQRLARAYATFRCAGECSVLFVPTCRDLGRFARAA